MGLIAARNGKLLFLTTLVDLLIQVIFLLMVINQVTSSRLSAAETASAETRKIAKEQNLTVAKALEGWRRLLATDSLNGRTAPNESERQREWEKLKAENEELKMERDRYSGKGGIDKPPCWKTEAKQPEYVLKIQMLEDGLFVRRGWPEKRAADLEKAGIKEEAFDDTLTLSEFSSMFAPFTQRPEFAGCTHFVLVSDKTETKVAYTKNLEAIEKLFYKSMRRE